MINNKTSMMTSSLSIPTSDNLLQVAPGSYFKVRENCRTMISEPTTGLVVSSYSKGDTGKAIYRVVLVDGELILVPMEGA